jgi:putative ABC transport system substrate-binding protein
MRRREFIGFLGGAAAGWPLTVRAQQPERMRRIGVLWAYSEADAVGQSQMAALRQGLQELGWSEGRNLGIDYRWGVGSADLEKVRKHAAELVALAPDVIVAGTGRHARELQALTRTVPIVFPGAVDPVGAGIVESLARPGGNATGFVAIEFSQSAKYPELLKEITPRVTRVAVIRDPTSAGGLGDFGVIQGAATSLGMEVRPVDSREVGAIERGLAAFASVPNGGLVVPQSALTTTHRELIVRLAAEYRLPAIYGSRIFVAAGGLISYGTVPNWQYRQVASYIDRILKGEKPGNLPVQAATRYETVLNLKTAKALGLDVPTSILLRADEVID